MQAMPRQIPTSSTISTSKPNARPGFRPHDLPAAPMSLREFPRPPGAEIRRVCRTYEIKCAGKYQPVLANNSSKTAGVSTPAWASKRIPNSAPLGERYVFELSRKVQQQVELLEDMLTTKDEEIAKLKEVKFPSEQTLENVSGTTAGIDSITYKNNMISERVSSLNEGEELDAMMPVKLHDEQLMKIETTVAAFYRSLQSQFRAEKKRTQEEHARQLGDARADKNAAADEVARLQHELNQAGTHIYAQQEAHHKEMTALRERDEKDRQQQLVAGSGPQLVPTPTQQVMERSMKEERERQALMCAWHNDKARANELQTENKYLRSRVTQLNALVRMMQSTL